MNIKKFYNKLIYFLIPLICILTLLSMKFIYKEELNWFLILNMILLSCISSLMFYFDRKYIKIFEIRKTTIIRKIIVVMLVILMSCLITYLMYIGLLKNSLNMTLYIIVILTALIVGYYNNIRLIYSTVFPELFPVCRKRLNYDELRIITKRTLSITKALYKVFRFKKVELLISDLSLIESKFDI